MSSCTCDNYEPRKIETFECATESLDHMIVCANCGRTPPDLEPASYMGVDFFIGKGAKPPVWDDANFFPSLNELEGKGPEERKRLLLGEWKPSPLLEDKEMLIRLKQWFNELYANNRSYLEREDYVLASYIYHVLEKPVPTHIRDKL